MAKYIGYARVSTNGQDLDLQLKDLKDVGCKNIFTDKVSGTKSRRPGLDACLNQSKEGRYAHRMALGPARAIHAAFGFGGGRPEGKGIGFRSLRDGAINTTRRRENLSSVSLRLLPSLKGS